MSNEILTGVAMKKFEEIIIPKSLSTKDVSLDPGITAQDRIMLMDAGKYEQMIEVWLSDCKKHKYDKVLRYAGSGDGGRDIAAFYGSYMDIYQCKHYDRQINMSDLAKELLKVCYHVLRQHYTSPKVYYIVSPKGCSTSSRTGYLEGQKHKNINGYIVEYLKKSTMKIEGEKLNTIKELFNMLKTFDFSIIEEVTPQELIDEFLESKYAIYYIGLSSKTFIREDIVLPDEIDDTESVYVNELCRVYSQKMGSSYNKPKDFPPMIDKHFQLQRTFYYSTLSYKDMVRDNLPSLEPFEAIEDLIHDGISEIIVDPFRDGYGKLQDSLERAVTMTIDNYVLKQLIKPNEKKGVCHTLVNGRRMKWID